MPTPRVPPQSQSQLETLVGPAPERELEATEETLAGDDAAASVAELDQTMLGESGPASASPSPNVSAGPGATIGRYVVLGKLGAGAMGVVYAAYDPELDRKVAVKLLRPERSGDQTVARERLLREAQALAKLNHAHVVTVHDVGVHGGQVFVAMEFVAGQTLGDWLAAGRRSWREVLRVFEAAGQGLAAAHAQGLVHRDFKPDNVMLGDDGRVRVMDFGLARAAEAGPSGRGVEPGPESSAAINPATRGSSLTRTGTVMGTPAYMAPEQFSGLAEVTARSDQFGFCVALFEGLYGRRPFVGETLIALMAAVQTGEITEPASRGEVPRWLDAVVRKGLATDPNQRFPDMPALLAALREGEAGARRKRVGVATALTLGALASVVAGAVGLERYEEAKTTAACEALGEAITADWNDEARARVRAGLEATGVGYAEQTADQVLMGLDAHAQAWAAAQTDACVRTRVGAEATGSEGPAWTEDLLSRASWCLDERRLELAALVGELVDADLTTVEKAIDAVNGLGALDRCVDVAWLERSPAPPSDRAGVEAVRERLAEVVALDATGDYAQALRASEDVLREAQALGWAPIEAAALFAVGRGRVRIGEYAAAERSLEDAYFLAMGAGGYAEASMSASLLVAVVGDRLGRPDEGLRWARHLARVDALLGQPADGLAAAATAMNIGSAQLAKGELEAARASYARALAIREAARGPEHPDVALALLNLGSAQRRLGELDAAKLSAERALAIFAATKGAAHPEYAHALANLGVSDMDVGDFAAGTSRYEQALLVLEQALGPTHPEVVNTLVNLGDGYSQLGRFAEAEAALARAIAISTEWDSPNHALTAGALLNLGTLHLTQGAPAKARPLYERALTILAGKPGSEHLLGKIHNNLGDTLLGFGELAAAREQFELAGAAHAKALAADDPEQAFPPAGLAQVALAEGKLADAIPLLEQALAVPPDPGVAVQIELMLAQALWDAPEGAGQDRARALELGEKVLAATESPDVAAWLAARRPPP